MLNSFEGRQDIKKTGLGRYPTGSTWALERSEQRHAGIFVLFSAVGGSMSEIVVLQGHRLRGVGGPG